jgi:hypothetical protein
MNRRGRIAVAGAAVVLLWAGLAYNVSRPVEPGAYRRTLLQVAASAHDATSTGKLIAEQVLDGRVTSPFATAAFGDAGKALAGAQKKFAGQPPPDDASAGLRDQLAPLLAAATPALGDTARATEDVALRSGADKLGSIAERLDDFITANES